MRRAVAISKKTYQWHLLGLGLRKPDELERTLAAMARRGWTRCYLLECGGVATAFMIGYLYAGTYYYVDVGFDPDWEKWSVGTVLHLEVLRDLVGGNAARSFDFSSGLRHPQEALQQRIARRGQLPAGPHGARNNIFDRRLPRHGRLVGRRGGLSDRLHLKTAVKRLVRRHATDKANDD